MAPSPSPDSFAGSVAAPTRGAPGRGAHHRPYRAATRSQFDDAFEWATRAACRSLSPAEFFPSNSRGIDGAINVCAVCPVRAECLEYALTNRLEHGVWGGMTERERGRILRQHDLPATPHGEGRVVVTRMSQIQKRRSS